MRLDELLDKVDRALLVWEHTKTKHHLTTALIEEGRAIWKEEHDKFNADRG